MTSPDTTHKCFVSIDMASRPDPPSSKEVTKKITTKDVLSEDLPIVPAPQTNNDPSTIVDMLALVPNEDTEPTNNEPIARPALFGSSGQVPQLGHPGGPSLLANDTNRSSFFLPDFVRRFLTTTTTTTTTYSVPPQVINRPDAEQPLLPNIQQQQQHPNNQEAVLDYQGRGLRVQQHNSNHQMQQHHSEGMMSPRLSNRRAGLVMVSLIGLIIGVVLLKESTHHAASTSPPLDRPTALHGCTVKFGISGLLQNSINEWFLVGAGRNLNVVLDDCNWESFFGSVVALLTIRESLNVTNQKWQTNHPLESIRDICRWPGVRCNNDKSGVTGLFLNHANLTGSIPTEILGLQPHLRQLSLENNDGLTGPIPEEIASLHDLEHIRLQQTSLQGSIPSVLGTLRSLEELLLDHTRLYGSVPAQLCALRSERLRTIHVDCKEGKVECSCCTQCY